MLWQKPYHTTFRVGQHMWQRAAMNAKDPTSHNYVAAKQVCST